MQHVTSEVRAEAVVPKLCLCTKKLNTYDCQTQCHYMSTGKLNVFGCCPKVSEMNINPAEIMLKELTIFGTLVDHFTFPAAATLVSDMADK